MDQMTNEQRRQLMDNGADENRDKDHFPVVKFYSPATNAVWLLSYIDHSSAAFGLCDLDDGKPSLGYVTQHELARFDQFPDMAVRIDRDFKALYPLSVYATAAKAFGGFTEDEAILKAAAAGAAQTLESFRPEMRMMTAEQRSQLLRNGHPDNRGKDHYPVVKFFMVDAGARWLLTELDPDEPDMAFGLCDLGVGFPELGYALMSELASIGGKFGLPVERDRYFKARYPISVYARAASLAQEITEDVRLLEIAQLDQSPQPSQMPRPPQP